MKTKMKMTTAVTAQAPTNPAARVVTCTALWMDIVSFVPGLPVWVVEYERRSGECDEAKDTAVAVDTHQDASELTEATTATVTTAAPTVAHTANLPGLLPRLAVKRHDLATLERLHHLSIQRQYRKSSKLWFHSAMHTAACVGDVASLQWLHQHTKVRCHTGSMLAAATRGHLDALKWLHVHRPESELALSPQAMDAAARGGFLDVVHFLHEQRTEGCTKFAMDFAAGNGHLDVVQFLHTHRQEGCTKLAIDQAATKGHVHVVAWLLQHRTEGYTMCAAHAAILNQHLDVLRVMIQHCDGIDPESALAHGITYGTLAIAVNGDCETLQALLEIVGEPFACYTMATAATYGQLEVVKLLHASRPQCDLAESLIRGAKLPGSAISQFLLEQGYVFSRETLSTAMERTSDLSLKILLQCRINELGDDPLATNYFRSVSSALSSRKHTTKTNSTTTPKKAKRVSATKKKLANAKTKKTTTAARAPPDTDSHVDNSSERLPTQAMSSPWMHAWTMITAAP